MIVNNARWTMKHGMENKCLRRMESTENLSS